MAEIHERTWPLDGAKGAVLIVHGLAEHSGRYEWVAQQLNAAGYAVHAIDLRGHGGSVGFPGDMGQDVGRIILDIVEHAVGLSAAHERTFLLAHSMGTLFTIPATGQMPEGTLSGLILSGTAIQPAEAALESMQGGPGLPADAISRSPEIVQAYVDDPLVFNEQVPPEILGLFGEVFAKVVETIPLINVPVLLIHGTDDKLVSIEGANMVHAQLVTTDKTLIGYEGLYHEVLNEPERDKVIADVIEWLEKH